jgi:hypothetical protein
MSVYDLFSPLSRVVTFLKVQLGKSTEEDNYFDITSYSIVNKLSG